MAGRLTFRPVDARTRADFVEVFAGPGGPKYCWCMAYRATKAEGAGRPGDVRREQMLGRIDRKVPVGLVGYDGDEPVAWVSVAPKETFPRIGGPDQPPGETVWSLSCMYIRRQLRGAGLAHEMIDAAVEYAKAAGANALEAYPVDPDSPSYRFMGFVPAFERAGFIEVAREGSRRHVMQLTLKRGSRGKG